MPRIDGAASLSHIAGGEDDLPFLALFGTARLKESRMAWVWLGVAGVLEIVWAFALKQSAGFSKPVEAVIAVIAMIASFVVLSLAMKSLPLGTAYTIWTGIGAVGAFVLGVIVLGEAATPLRVVSAGLILAGIVGLRLAAE
jgi:quaternary ammonium compound-resistance protein SugE